MRKGYPDLKTAKAIIENVIASRRQGEHPFSEKTEQGFYQHCISVADIAAQIASKTSHLDPEKSYVLGLLHDCGRVRDEWHENVFHGLVGYDYLQEKGYTAAAKIAFSHCFYEPQLNLSAYRMTPTDYVRSRELLKNMKFSDYDLLIQLSDILNDCGQTCTVEYRFASVAKRHPIDAATITGSINKMNQLKTYFSDKCCCDVYRLLDIKESISI